MYATDAQFAAARPDETISAAIQRPGLRLAQLVGRIADYHEWLQRFETAMRALPDRQRQQSVLPLLHHYQEPEKPLRGALASTERFRAAVQEAKIGPDKDIPHVTAPMIVKYMTDLQLLGLLWWCLVVCLANKRQFVGRAEPILQR